MKAIPHQKITYTFEAFDGTEFNTKEECIAYEDKITQSKEYKLSKYLIVQDCIPLQWGDYLSESCSYTWFKVANEDEFEDLCNIIQSNCRHPKKYPAYICVEDFDITEPCEYVYPMDSIMEDVESFFGMFEYTVSFNRKEK